MNKAELISATAEKAGLSKKDSEKALNALIETITEAMKRGDKVQLVGFAYSRSRRVGPHGKEPQTKEQTDTRLKGSSFKAGKALGDSIKRLTARAYYPCRLDI